MASTQTSFNDKVFTGPSLLEKMEAKGVDMQWYRRGRRNNLGDTEAPLDSALCSEGSIYLLKRDGSLWTITHNVEPYRQVRQTKHRPTKQVFICVCCGGQSPTKRRLKHLPKELMQKVVDK